MIDFQNVWMAYNRTEYVLKDLSLSIHKGENYFIIGSSGSGKSTILKLMNGTLNPFKGVVTILGEKPDLKNKKFKLKMRKIGYMPQNLGLVKNISVLENVLLGSLPSMNIWRSLLKMFKDGDIESAKNALEMVGLDGKESRKAHMLSGGEKRRVIIARTLTQKPDIILADEIVSELDHTTAEEIMTLMTNTRKRLGITTVMVHHDIGITIEYADRVLVMRKGEKSGEYNVDETNETKLLETLKN